MPPLIQCVRLAERGATVPIPLDMIASRTVSFGREHSSVSALLRLAPSDKSRSCPDRHRDARDEVTGEHALKSRAVR